MGYDGRRLVLRNLPGVPRRPSEDLHVLLYRHAYTHRVKRCPLVLDGSRNPCWVILRSRDVFEDLLDRPLDRYGVLHMHRTSSFATPAFPRGAYCITDDDPKLSQRQPRTLESLIHRSAWKRNSPKFISKILHNHTPVPHEITPPDIPHSPTPLELVTLMDRYARWWMPSYCKLMFALRREYPMPRPAA